VHERGIRRDYQKRKNERESGNISHRLLRLLGKGWDSHPKGRGGKESEEPVEGNFPLIIERPGDRGNSSRETFSPSIERRKTEGY